MRLQTQELGMALGGKQIIEGVEVDVGRKEFVGLIGPNGSGKSTLLKCVYRVLQPSCGAVLLDGQELRRLRVRESAKRVAVVSQHNYYNFDFAVREVVLMGRAPHKRAMERDTAEDFHIVEEALRTVEMEDFADRAFSTLSGGEQQRVILARALAQQTPCLLLDEPTNHLDLKYQLQLMDIVKGLRVTVLSAIHDLNIAAMYCDRLYVLKEGRILASGTPEEILTEALIWEVYEVRVEVLRAKGGGIHILYQSQTEQRRMTS
ncbi:MAG TPA: ABC transporter ATP-binding protein [Clostridia bacterium]|nr:ABC transporter ATP-binding protein [Clostridia bacterium]